MANNKDEIMSLRQRLQNRIDMLDEVYFMVENTENWFKKTKPVIENLSQFLEGDEVNGITISDELKFQIKNMRIELILEILDKTYAGGMFSKYDLTAACYFIYHADISKYSDILYEKIKYLSFDEYTSGIKSTAYNKLLRCISAENAFKMLIDILEEYPNSASVYGIKANKNINENNIKQLFDIDTKYDTDLTSSFVEYLSDEQVIYLCQRDNMRPWQISEIAASCNLSKDLEIYFSTFSYANVRKALVKNTQLSDETLTFLSKDLKISVAAAAVNEINRRFTFNAN